MKNETALPASMAAYDLLAPIQDLTPRPFSEAEGATYTDPAGRRFLDLDEMCVILGQHNGPFADRVSRALTEEITSGKCRFGAAKDALYRDLIRTTHGDFAAVHLTASGSESVEWAVRLAQRMTGRSEVLSFWNSIHGRTYLSASLSGLPRRKAGYGPLAPGVIFAPYPRCGTCPRRESCGQGRFPCLEELEKLYRYSSAQDAAAVIIEPYQGADITFPPEGYLAALHRWARGHGLLTILDEIQSGMGRTGMLYCYQREGFCPDFLLLGKALGNGLHISALLVRERPDPAFLPAVSGGVGDEALACTAASEVFRQLEDGLLEHVGAVGELLTSGLKRLETAYPCVRESRGRGLAAAIEFTTEAAGQAVFQRLSEEGCWLGHKGAALLLKPPYVITREQIEDFLDALERAIRSLESEAPAL